jgi:hypothetical protein
MSRAWPKIRGIALLSAGAIAVHELRYIAGYGGSADEALAEQGHSYMSMAFALTALLLLAAGLRFAVTVMRASRGEAPSERPPRFVSSWARAGAALACIYVLQEGFEGSYSAGHPGGLVGIFGHGGWTALVFAVLVGAVIGAVTCIAHDAVVLVARRAACRRLQPAPTPTPSRSVHRALPRLRSDVLAWNLAGRAPPPQQV